MPASSPAAVHAQAIGLRCPLCGRDDAPSWLSFDGLEIARCPGCRSGFVVQTPEVDRQRRHYDESSRLYEAELDARKPARCWELLRSCTSDLRGISSILDVGCGEGKFLDIARAAGLRTAGVEISERAARTATDKGHHVHRQSVTGAPFARGEYDVAVMWDILEHLDRPRQGLRNVAAALKPGGMLVVLTPMMGSIYDRLGGLLYQASGGHFDRLVRMCWNRDHLFRYSPRGLAAVLNELNFYRVVAEPVLLLSLESEAYAGGGLTPGWTRSPRVNRLISSCGVRVGRALSLHNKVLVRARRGPGEVGDA